MTARLNGDPLGISAVFSDGTAVTIGFGATPDAVLAGELLAGLTDLVHPHGRIDTGTTLGIYVRAARELVTAVAGAGHAGSAAGLTRARLAGFCWGTDGRTEAAGRRMLSALDAQAAVLRPEVRELAAGRKFNTWVAVPPLEPYSEGEWSRLLEAVAGALAAVPAVRARRAPHRAVDTAPPRREHRRRAARDLARQQDHHSHGPGLGEAASAARDDGEPFRVHRHRIRTTFESHRDRRSWFGSGRATVDPNHTPRVEGDHYLTAATPAQRHNAETLIEAAQADLLRRAHPPAVLTAGQAADLAGQFPELVSRMGLDDTAIGELTGGERDVFVAACADPLSGLHGPKGKPCPARPWVCLLCPLSLFAPRHAGNLLRMKAFSGRQWLQMPAPQFMAVFGPYAQRIDEILEAFRRNDPGILAAAGGVAGTDDELPLLPEERTG